MPARGSSSLLEVDQGDGDGGGARRRPYLDGPGASAESESADATSDQTPCVICQDQAKTHAFVPCGHRCVCEACGKRLMALRTRRVCPICRQPATSSMRIWN